MPKLSLVGLSKRFQSVAAVSNVNLEVPPGEFVALLGPSGSGKTTLLRMLAGFELPTTGQIRIGDRDVSRLSPAERDIGMVFQQYALFPHLSVRCNVEYGLKMRGWTRIARKKRSDEILGMVRLEGLADRLPRQLSGGQQQRVALARALAYAPNFLLMDEPLGALDRALRIEMTEEIRRIHRTLRTTFIYVTHDRDEAMTLASRVLVINRGEIVADGSAESLYSTPSSSFVATFFSGMNIVNGDRLPAAAVEVGRKYGVLPAKLQLQRPDAAHVAFTGEVLDSLFLGDTVQTSIKCADMDSPLLIHAHPSEGARVKPGDRITAYVNCNDMVALGP